MAKGMLVQFKFKLNQVVKTPLGEKGIITMLGVDASGPQYFVVTKNNSQWFTQDLFKVK